MLVPSYCFLAGIRDIYYNYENLRVCNGLPDEVQVQSGQDPDLFTLDTVCDFFKQFDEQIACCPGKINIGVLKQCAFSFFTILSHVTRDTV